MSDQFTQVLLIEDNEGDADFIRSRLIETNSSLQVTCANRLATGLAALAIDPPAVVLLDLNLPDSRGAETLNNVLNKAPGVPVVILSGQEDQEFAAKAVHQGVQEYLVKGAFDIKQLEHAVRYAIGRQALLTARDMNRKQQLQYKDELLSHVSHELRTPLTCAHQFVTIVLDGLAGPISSEQRDHLETALLSVNQLRAMIGGLLDATRVESGKIRIDPCCVAVGDLVQQSATMMRPVARARQVALEVSVDGRLLLVSADAHRILQVLINLIDNATKFTPPKGSVRVNARLFEADPAFICISVADSGRGIRPEAKTLIFERLYQDSNGIENGLGLGLYIVRELVRLHGGRIWVESQVGYGSTFSFTLPVFPLSQFLFPVIVDQGRLPSSLALLTIEVSSRWTSAAVDWRDRWLKLLRSCIVYTKDVILPPMGASGEGETFWIVASADVSGANILAQRIRRQLESGEEAKAGVGFKVSVAAVRLPSSKHGWSLEKQMTEVAAVITGMVLKDITTSHPPRATNSQNPVNFGTHKEIDNGQTKDPDR